MKSVFLKIITLLAMISSVLLTSCFNTCNILSVNNISAVSAVSFRPYYMDGGSGEMNCTPDMCSVTVKNAGDKSYSVMAAVEGIVLESPKNYSFDFSVSSTVNRTIIVTVEDSSYNRVFEKSIIAYEQKNTYHYEICPQDPGIYDIKFHMGKTDDMVQSCEHTVNITDFSWNNEIVQSAKGTDPAVDKEKNWIMTWSDEFDSNELDKDKWSYDIGNWKTDDNGNYITNGWGNNEQQYYTDKNAQVSDGTLKIYAKKEQYSDSVQGNYNYTSSRITTKNKFSTCYGKVEVRAKTDSGKSLWPALWMLPEDNVYGDWAASGEIDIMEGYGSRPKEICGTIHFGDVWPGNTYLTQTYFYEGNDSAENWHTYSIEWDEKCIKWYVDDNLYSTQTNWYCAGRQYPAPFNQNFYLIINLAVGGHFDGVDGIYADDSIFADGAKKMEIDYIRVYQDDGKQYTPVKPDSEVLYPYVEDASAVLSNSDSGCLVKIADTGSKEYSVMGILKNADVIASHVYCLDFDAVCSISRNILITAEDTSFDRYFDKKISLGQDKKHFHFEIPFNNNMKTDIKFQMGNIDNASDLPDHTVLISDIKFEDKDTQNNLYGDADMNSVVDMSDMTLISQHCLGDIKLEGQAFENSDVVIDLHVNLSDLSMMKQYIMKDNVTLGVKPSNF